MSSSRDEPSPNSGRRLANSIKGKKYIIDNNNGIGSQEYSSNYNTMKQRKRQKVNSILRNVSSDQPPTGIDRSTMGNIMIGSLNESFSNIP